MAVLALEGQSTPGAFADQLPLHLTKAAKNRQKEATVRRSRIDALAYAVQFDLPLYEQILHETQEVTSATGEAVHFCYDYMLNFASFTPSYELT